VSLKAGSDTDHLVDDDFELEAQRDAVNYAQAQEIEAKRETIRQLNKARRKAGLSALTVPRKIKASATIPKLEDPDGPSSANSSESDEDHINPFRDPAGTKELRYEGRRICHPSARSGEAC
jgi:hypothetical protein